MQSASVPQGDRNPNGYTEEEVLRAIRGVDGTRELSFRYELLDKDMNFKRELDNVLGGAVQMHYISEIKRTADLTIRDQGNIDWLFDQVKPFIRVKMPPRTVQDGILVDTLWENSFDSTVNLGDITIENMSDSGDPASSVQGTVRYWTGWSAAGPSSCMLGGPGLPDGFIDLKFMARSTWKISFYANVFAGSYLNVYPNGISEDPSRYLQFDDLFGNYRLGGINIQNLRDNVIGQPIRVEVVNDGFRCRYSLWWTDLDSDTPDFSASEDSSHWQPIQVVWLSGGGNNDPFRLGVGVDEFRVGVPGATEVIPRIQNIWYNSFDGDPDMFVDMDSLRLFGNLPNDLTGYLSFNTDWSASGEASLQLGEIGSGSGSMTATLPPRTEWSLQTHAYIPEGGKLYIAPSREDFVPPPDEAPPYPGPITRNGTTGSQDWSLSVTTPVPSGTAQGDFMMAVATSNGNGTLSYDPSWEQVLVREIGDDAFIYVFTKTAGSSEPMNYEWTFDTEHWHSAMITSWKNVVGLRQIGVNLGEDVPSPLPLPIQGAISGDTAVVVGFDWGEVSRQWSDPAYYYPELNLSRGLIVGSRQALPTGPTPSHSMVTSSSDPSRMATITAVLQHIPDPNNIDPYPGPIQFVSSSEAPETWTDVNNVPVPAGTSQGDYMISVLTSNSGEDLDPPAGWDFLNSHTMGSGTSMHFYGRFADVGEPGSYAWSWDVEHWHRGSCFTWRNTLGPRFTNVAGADGISSVMTPSGVASTGDALMITGFDWGDNSKVFSNGNGAPTTILNQSGESGSLVARVMDLSAGNIPRFNFTSSAANPSRMGACSIVLEAFVDMDDGIGPYRGSNWIVLDDEGGEYTIAGVDVSADQFREFLFDRPIRIEMESDGSTYAWRIYATDPDGSNPDINWYGDSSKWDPMTAFLFQGGGETAEPTLIDETRIGRMIPVDRETPDEENFVEFPMGVFLMTSPERESDEDDVVTREIECYDRTKLFIDDKIDEPFAIKKGEPYVPIIEDLLGDVPKIVDPGDAVCGRDREFSIGTSKKEIIDRIAEGINYHTLRIDEEGRAVVQRYVNPTNRSPEYDYYDDEVSIMYPDVSVEFDAFDIANVFIVSSSEGDGPPIYAKLENHDPANPFSIPRRGRRIVDFREEEEASDQNSLLRKVKRLQFEANRLYENVSFNTLINPLHSANDCYNIKYGPLGVAEKYTEINWEIPLEAGATMTHTARRVVLLDAEADEGFIEDHLEVVGSLTAGNIKWGQVSIPYTGNPTTYPTNTPVQVTVSGLNLKGSGPVQVFVTPSTGVPGTTVRQITTQNETADGFQVWSTRRTQTTNSVYWLAMRSL